MISPNPSHKPPAHHNPPPQKDFRDSIIGVYSGQYHDYEARIKKINDTTYTLDTTSETFLNIRVKIEPHQDSSILITPLDTILLEVMALTLNDSTNGSGRAGSYAALIEFKNDSLFYRSGYINRTRPSGRSITAAKE